MNTELIFTNHVADAIDNAVASLKPSDVFVLADVNTSQYALPILQRMSSTIAKAKIITCLAGDLNKNLEQLAKVWTALSAGEATRTALLINLGGGTVTDLGGFAAATFKRGMKTLNIPTTLLGAVDASVGGKTAINFGGIKNMVGVFNKPDMVIISTVFFGSLPQQEMLSGYAEMIKHGLLKSQTTLNDLLAYDITRPHNSDNRLLGLIRESVLIKEDIVSKDPTEKGLRRTLNLGHTVGHAFEAMAMKRLSPIPHGYAVVWGIVVELVLSHMLKQLDSAVLHKVAGYVRESYGAFDITCNDYPQLLGYMRQDKKNLDNTHINFTLLRAVGDPVINVTATDEQIKTALDIYRDLMGI
jgi:3-dehydroquinate synthase